jgi:hypothetical protein
VPRELGDVLHYFLPEVGASPDGAPGAPVISVPLGPHDLVRGALLWNLAVELSRSGAQVTLVVPRPGAAWALSAPAGRGPLGLEIVHTAGGEVAELGQCAREAAARGDPAGREGLVLTAVPPPWLGKGTDAAAVLGWVIALCRTEPRDLEETAAVLASAASSAPSARLGASVFGARCVGGARAAFEQLAAAVEPRVGRPLESYGLLVDDVQLSRSIVSRRPIPLSHPGSPAARALADVARLILEDRREAMRDG